jgi:hypothetical protein
MPQTPDQLVPALARWLAPHIARELGLTMPGTAPVAGGYDDVTCALFVSELGTGVLNRAAGFFAKLDLDGQVGSVELAQHLNLGTPRNISSALTNSLKQRASALGLDRPWREGVSTDNRTVWVDRDGIAARMCAAIRAEQQRRFDA